MKQISCRHVVYPKKSKISGKGSSMISKLAPVQILCDVLHGTHRDCRVSSVCGAGGSEGCASESLVFPYETPIFQKLGSSAWAHCLVSTGNAGGAMAKVRNDCNRSACVYCCSSVALQNICVSCNLSQISAVEYLYCPDSLVFLERKRTTLQLTGSKSSASKQTG